MSKSESISHPSRATGEGDLVWLGERAYPFATEGSPVQRMTDSNHLLGKPKELWAELQSKGYILIRGVHDRDAVLQGRTTVLNHLHQQGGKLDPAHPVEDGVLLKNCGSACVPFMEGENDITKSDGIANVLESDRIKKFFEKSLFEEKCRTFDYKWLRAMHVGGFTGAHTDSVYMSRGTKDLITMWTPFGDVDTSMGTIAVIEGSNSNESYAKLRDTYSKMDAEREGLKGTGWFTTDPQEILERFGGTWKTTDFRAGDALFFTMTTVHMSTKNISGLARVSCDTRWLKASETPDPRYVWEQGKRPKPSTSKFGVHADATEAGVTIEQKKLDWGFE
eukprot:m.975888 g.975888  ORF g.975888 m.975888 type:complete len:335 (-) comp23943_c0_seq7:3499-4503(-)